MYCVTWQSLKVCDLHQILKVDSGWKFSWTQSAHRHLLFLFEWSAHNAPLNKVTESASCQRRLGKKKFQFSWWIIGEWDFLRDFLLGASLAIPNPSHCAGQIFTKKDVCCFKIIVSKSSLSSAIEEILGRCMSLHDALPLPSFLFTIYSPDFIAFSGSNPKRLPFRAIKWDGSFSIT